MATKLELQQIEKAQASARAQVDWYAQNNLYYDKPPKLGKASWGLALHPHFISSEQHRTLLSVTPLVLADYHRTTAHLMDLALDANARKESFPLQQLYQVLTFTNPPETEALWKDMLVVANTLPASTRPDILVPANSSPTFQHIEYNADGSADKGNTLGVAKVTREILGYPTIGVGLDKAFMDGIRHKLPHHDQITVATVKPDFYRTEYDPQNDFFAKQIDGKEGLKWLSVKASELEFQADGVYVENKKIDIIDREVKAPGFKDDYDFKSEMALYRAVIEQKVSILGSILPHSDKIFLAALFDPLLEKSIVEAIGRERLSRLRSYHPTTHLFTPEKTTYQFADNHFSLKDIRNPSSDQGFVLKHTGDNIYTTGSNGVYLSKGYKHEEWAEIVDHAYSTGIGKRTHLVLQELVEPEKFDIQTISSTTAQPKHFTVPVRFAPYYVWNGSDYLLGDALVTAGTDREVASLNSYNIHGQRANTYQGVAYSTSQPPR